jgi:hypothetical protein
MNGDELDTVVDYVTDDSGVFDAEKFHKMWPSDPADQRRIIGMLTARSYRENHAQNKAIKSQWGFLVMALVLGTIGAVHVLGADQFMAAITGMAVGALAQGIKMIITNA